MERSRENGAWTTASGEERVEKGVWKNTGWRTANGERRVYNTA